MSRPSTGSEPDPWRAPVIVAQIPDAGLHRELEASAAERQAMAELAGVREILSAHASFDVVPKSGGRVQVTGLVRGRIGQTCVVTLDPVESEIEVNSAHGTSSNATTATSSGMRSLRACRVSKAPNVIRLFAMKSASIGGSRLRSPAARSAPLPSLNVPIHSSVGSNGTPASLSAWRYPSRRCLPVVVEIGPVISPMRR